MRIRSLILTLLLVSPFAAAGNLECNQVKQGMPTIYRCIYHGNLAQAYAALRANRSEDDALRLLHVLQAAAQSFQMSDVDVPAMAQMDTELLLHVCKKSRKLLHEPAAVLLDALLSDEAVPIGDGLDLSSVHKEVLK